MSHDLIFSHEFIFGGINQSINLETEVVVDDPLILQSTHQNVAESIQTNFFTPDHSHHEA